MSFKFNEMRRKLFTCGVPLLGAAAGGAFLSSGCEIQKKSKPAGNISLPSGGIYAKYNDKLPKLFTAVLQDVMDVMNVRDQCMDPQIRPLLPGMRTWGEAITIYLEAVNEVPKEPFQMEMELIDNSKPGQIIIAQADAPKLSAFWGGLLTNAAAGHKVAGVITDGGVRDYDEILELNFPAFCAGLTPYDSLGRMDGKKKNVPIVCGGVKVAPGDLIFADVVGVVVVPQDIVDQVIAKAWEKVQGESTVREELRSGAGVEKTFKKYHVL
ncbi:MAG: RraA family protein [Candidatus Latescibacterota bacterium]